MIILNISNMPVWLWGKDRGIPSVFFPQKEFAGAGHDVRFLCPVKGDEPAYSFMEGVHIRRFDFPFNFRKKSYFQVYSFLQRLRVTLLSNLNWLSFQISGFIQTAKLALKVRPDIIYAHSPASVLPAYFVSVLFRAKLVVRIYGTRQLFWLWRNFFLRLKEFRDYLVFKIPAHYFIVTNDGSRGDLVAKKMGVRDEKIKYWRNGIDESFYEEVPGAKEDVCSFLNVKSSVKIIASTCRLNYEYGIDRVLNILVELFKKQDDCIFVIAGSGPEEKRLKEFIKKNNISSRVFFLGILDRKTLKKILYAADLFLFLPRYYNCTNTVWEAMATGRCIVTTETELIKEVLTSEQDSILVSEEGLNDLPDILEKLLNNDSFREQLGNNARKRAKEILEPWPVRIEKEAKLLEDLVAGSR